MNVINGLAYADVPAAPLKVAGVRPLEGHRLLVRFTTGETQIFDFTPLLSTPAFAPLADEKTFSAIGIDHGVPVWNDGEVDISPDTLNRQGVPCDSH